MAEYRKYKCKTCGHVYDEELGDPRQGVAPGTRWEDVPEDWCCPKCGAVKSMFNLVRS
jgi:rubredoxin